MSEIWVQVLQTFVLKYKCIFFFSLATLYINSQYLERIGSS